MEHLAFVRRPPRKAARGTDDDSALLQGEGCWEVSVGEVALEKVIGLARQMGLKSCKARETNPKARKSVWYNHADADGPGGSYKSRYGAN